MYDSVAGSNNQRFTEFHASLADGSELPAWVSIDSTGTLMADAPTDVEKLSLKIVGTKADGTAIARIVEIDTQTGAISDKGAEKMGAKTFTQALSEAL